MAGRILTDVANPALDGNGKPMDGSTLTYFQTGTTTLAIIYSGGDTITALPNPLYSDAAGRFVEVWSNQTVDVAWKDPAGVLIDTLEGLAPVGEASGGGRLIYVNGDPQDNQGQNGDTARDFTRGIDTGPKKNGTWLGAGTYVFASHTQPGISAEALAVFAAMPVQPSTARKQLINTIIVRLKNLGAWDRLTALYVQAAHDVSAYPINWKQPGTFNTIGLLGTPNFITDAGVAAVGDEYLSTQYNTLTSGGSFSQNSACYFSWMALAQADDAPIIATVDIHNTLFPRFTDSNFYVRLQNNAASSSGAYAGAAGFHLVNRADSTALNYWYNGAQVGATLSQPSVAPTSTTLNLLGRGDDPGFDSNKGRMAIMGFGSAMTGLEADLYAIFSDYMSTVYVPFLNGWTANQLYVGRPEPIVYFEPNILVIGGRDPTGGRLSRSTNNGDTWADLGTPYGSDDINSMQAATGGIGFMTRGNGHVWKTTNSGLTWTDLGLIASITPNYSLTIKIYASHITETGAWLVSTTDGRVFRSINQGASWTQVASVSGEAFYKFTTIGSGAIMLNSFSGKVYKSSNDGVTWTFKQTLGVGGNQLYAGGYMGSNICLQATADSIMWRSTDNGETWSNIGRFYADSALADIIVPLGNGRAIYSVTENAVLNQIILTEDNGLTWGVVGSIEELNNLPADGLSEMIIYTAGGTTYYAGTTDKGYFVRSIRP